MEPTALDILPDGTLFTALKGFDHIDNGIVLSRYIPGMTYRLTARNRALVAKAIGDKQARLGGLDGSATVDASTKARGAIATG